MYIARLLRLLHINLVLVRHGLDEIVLSLHLFRPFRFLMLLNPFMWGGGRRRAPLGVRLREALQDLGPVFVKFGQMLSTRRDLLPDEIALELAALQDKVPPFPGDEAQAIIEKALGLPVDMVFAEFDTRPLASASIAQVHAARLQDGREVVVKVVRPGIERRIRRDVGLMYTLADLARRFWADARRLRPREIVAEYEGIIYDELDLIREASNASQLRRNFLHSPLLYVPAVEWDLCRRNVLVMERIRGIPISDIDQMRRRGIDLKKLSERGVEIFFTQVFRHNFFHADMHPGNIFVSYERPEAPRYIGVDFGIMGTLAPRDQRYLAENFVAFFNRDYQRVAELHVESGWVAADTRVDEFESAIRAVCEPIFQRPLSEISFGQLLLRLFQTARRFNMEVQPQLVLLQKTLLNIEGLGRQLDPDLDLWATAKPFLERWMSEQLGPRALLRGLKRNLPYIAEKLPDVPELAYKVLSQAADGNLKLRWESEQVAALREEVRQANDRTVRAVSGSALLICAFLALGLETKWVFALGAFEAPVLSWLLGVGGILLLISAWRRA